jgi:hypothetical protein
MGSRFAICFPVACRSSGEIAEPNWDVESWCGFAGGLLGNGKTRDDLRGIARG